MADKELRIKYILDKSQFDPAIKAVNQGLQDTGKHLRDGTDAAGQMRSAMMQLVGIQTGMAAVGQVVGAIGSSMKEAADYTKRVAEAFGVTRDAMREIAAIQGKGLTGDFVQSQLDVAKKAQILTPQEMTTGSLAFQQFGSAYIGDQGNDPATGKDNGSRISQGQLDELLPSVFAAAKVQGVEQGAAGQIFAKIVQAMPAHSKTADYKDTFAKVLEMSKNSSGSASMTANQLGPFMSANVTEGGAFEPTMQGILSATKMVAAVSEVKPEEAGAYTNQLIQDLTRIDLKGKENEFGITDDMTPEQKMTAIGDTWKRETGGKNFKNWYSKKLGRTGNVQAAAAASAIILKGINGGFFDAMEQRAAKVDGGTLDKALAQHMVDKPDDAAKASLAISEVERGKEYAGVELELTRAKGDLTKEGAFEQGAGLRLALSSGHLGGASSAQESMVNERALRNAQKAASDAGVNAYYGPDSFIGGAMGAQNMTELGMREEIKRLVELTAQANAQRARQVPAVPPPINGRPNAPGQMPR